LKIADYETIEYAIPVAGKTVKLLGPASPYALLDTEAVQRRFQADEYMPYWATPWVSAVMLTEYVVQESIPRQGSVLEIGAGLGLCGIALAMHGFRVTISDYDADALAFVRANAALNHVSLDDARELDWRQPREEQFDLIVGADVLYEKRNRQPVLDLIVKCLTANGRAILSDPNRGAVDGVDAFFRMGGMSIETLEVSSRAIPRPGSVDGRTLRGRIFSIMRPGECVDHIAITPDRSARNRVEMS